MLSQTLQTALNDAETALTAAQTAAKAETDGKSALDTAIKNDQTNVDALKKANDDLATARKAVIDAATTEFTLPQPQSQAPTAANVTDDAAAASGSPAAKPAA